MGKYYVAGIPFDSENCLMHYGVKNMEWGKHKFGIDADDCVQSTVAEMKMGVSPTRAEMMHGRSDTPLHLYE